MLELYLIRHGTTDRNRSGQLQGQVDVLLAEQGEEEACSTASRLSHLQQVEAVYTSTLKRATATAAPIAEALGVTPLEDARWMEMDVGDLAGMTWVEAEAQHPGTIALWYQEPRQVHFPGAQESIAQFVARVEQVLAELLVRHSDGRVVVVSHGGPLNVCLASMLRCGIPDLFPFHLSNCGISRVQVQSGRVRVHAVNDASHLTHQAAFQVP